MLEEFFEKHPLVKHSMTANKAVRDFYEFLVKSGAIGSAKFEEKQGIGVRRESGTRPEGQENGNYDLKNDYSDIFERDELDLVVRELRE